MNDDRSKVDELNDTLYSRTQYRDPVGTAHSVIPEAPASTTEDHWNSPSIDDMIKSDRRQGDRRAQGRSHLSKIFIGALVFFIAALGIAAYIYLGGSNFISSKNVDITASGPVTISAGGVLSLDIAITNRNNADLEEVNLGITYPEGTRDPVDTTKGLSYTKEAIGDIAAGKVVEKSEQAAIFGEQGEVKEITLTLDYKVKGSNATFNKQKTFDVTVGSVPVTMEVGGPATVTSGDIFTTTLTLTANSTDVLKNVLVRGEYPYGFTLVDSDPAAVNSDDNLWSVGDLAPGDKKVITIKGKLLGQDAEERTFRFSAGVSDPANPNIFDIALSSVAQTISIDRPSIGLDMALNSDTGETYVAPAGKPVLVTVKVTNNMPDTLTHAKIVAKLSGAALDRFSVQALGGGFYDSANNQIIWDENALPGLASLSAGDDQEVSFQFSSLANISAGAKNQEIDLSANVSGTPQGGAAVSVSDSRAVKIASEVTLAAKSLYSRGAFKNSGPIPPRAEKATTYTVVLDLKNTQNDISKSSVTATLGSNVQWLGAATSSEHISYDPNSGKITWALDTLTSGSGFSTPVREASFQVSLAPSIGQIGSSPILINNISFSGTDTFTNSPVSLTAPAVTTSINSDPSYIQGDETVVK